MPLQHSGRRLVFYSMGQPTIFGIVDIDYIAFRANSKISSIMAEWYLERGVVAFVWIGSFANQLWELMDLNERIIRGEGDLGMVRREGEVVDSRTVAFHNCLGYRLKALPVEQHHNSSWVSISYKSKLLSTNTHKKFLPQIPSYLANFKRANGF